MKQKSIGTLEEILITQMNHWALYPLYLGGIILLGEFVCVTPPHLMIWAVMGIFPLFLYWVRIHVQHIIPNVLCHGIVFLVAALLPGEHITIHILQSFFGLGYVILSLSIRGKQKGGLDKTLSPVFIVILAFVSLFYQNYLGHREWNLYLAVTVLLTLGLYFIVIYLQHYFRFLQVNDSSAGQIPAGLIFRSGFKMTFLYTLLTMTVAFLLSHIEWLGSILQKLRKGIAFCLYSILSLFPQDSGEKVVETITASTEAIEEMPMETVGETFVGWQFLEYLVEFLFMSGMIFVAYKGVRHLIVWLKTNSFFKGRKFYQETGDETEDLHEDCVIVRRKKKTRQFSFLRKQSFEQQIRRIYQSYILSHKRELAKETENLCFTTARENASTLGKQDLASIYEKARYSEEPCTKEDVRLMREICNSHRNAL